MNSKLLMIENRLHDILRFLPKTAKLSQLVLLGILLACVSDIALAANAGGTPLCSSNTDISVNEINTQDGWTEVFVRNTGVNLNSSPNKWILKVSDINAAPTAQTLGAGNGCVNTTGAACVADAYISYNVPDWINFAGFAPGKNNNSQVALFAPDGKLSSMVTLSTSSTACDYTNTYWGNPGSTCNVCVLNVNSNIKDYFAMPDGSNNWADSSNGNSAGLANGSQGTSNTGALTGCSIANSDCFQTFSTGTENTTNYCTARSLTVPVSLVYADKTGAPIVASSFVIPQWSPALSYTGNLSMLSGSATISSATQTWLGSTTANTTTTAKTVTFTNVVGDANGQIIFKIVDASLPGVSQTKTITLPSCLLADWRMDEPSWTGVSNEVKDSSGNGNHGTAKIAAGSTPVPTSLSGTPAYTSGTQSTCNYGQFDSTTGTTRTYTYVELSNMPTLPSSFTFAAWIRSTNATAQHQRILVRDDADNGWGLSLADGTGSNKLRFFNRNITNTGTVTGQGTNPSCGVFCLDTNAVVSTNAWNFIAASIDTAGKKITLYVYNASGTLLAKTSSSFSGTWADGSGKAAIGGETSSSSEGRQTSWHFLGNIDEVQVYSGVRSQSEIETDLIRVRACPTTSITPAKFNCIETGATASTGHLYTKLAGTAFSFDVAALKTDGTVETSYVAGTSKDVTLDLGYATDAACTGWAAVSPTVSQTLTFATADAGRKAASMTVSSAYPNLRCRVTDKNQTPNVVACSADNFAVRPTKLTVTSTDATADNTGASKIATPKIKAGANFNLQATALAGYNGSPKIDLTKVTSSTGNNGVLGGSLGAADSATGIASGTSMTYNEVGYFNFAVNGVYDDTFTAVDQSADCTTGYSNTLDLNGKYGCSFGNNTASNYFGRFVPDHFDTAVVLSSGVPMSCATLGLSCPALYNGFVYAGQAFKTQITARNLAGTTTTNYNTTTGFSKAVTLYAWDALGISAVTLPVAGVQNPGPGTLANSSVAASAFSNGVASLTNTSYSFNTVPTIPTSIYIRATEATGGDGVSSLWATNPTTNSIEGGVQVVSGRLKVSNAYGSELLPLSVVASAQYYGAVGNWLSNVADTVTTLTFPTTFAVGTGSTTVTLVPVSGVLSSGTLTVKLSKPGTAGIATITPTTFPAYLPVTSGKATFGIYNPNNNYIYQRESY